MLMLFVSCQVNTNPCSLSDEVLQDIQKLDSTIKVPEIRKMIRDRDKINYDEHSLLDATTETYRFMWSSSFDGTDIYRIEAINGYFKATTKSFVSHQDSIGTIREFNISKEDWTKIVGGFVAHNFWTYPSSIDRRGLDGASWTIEGYKPIKDECTQRNFHLIYRWSPIDTTFIAMCKLLYQLETHNTTRPELY